MRVAEAGPERKLRKALLRGVLRPAQLPAVRTSENRILRIQHSKPHIESLITPGVLRTKTSNLEITVIPKKPHKGLVSRFISSVRRHDLKIHAGRITDRKDVAFNRFAERRDVYSISAKRELVKVDPFFINPNKNALNGGRPIK